MTRQPKRPLLSRTLRLAMLAASLAVPSNAQSGTISLATSPLATTTTSSVKPNLLLVIDNSGSMDWDHMPDDATDGGSSVPWSYGYYGLRSHQCNEVYYNPAITYLPPVHPDGTDYPNSTFTAAWTNGYSTGAGTTNLDTSYLASASLMSDTFAQAAYYYGYQGTQTTSTQKNYQSTTNAFYKECHDSTGASTSARAPNFGVTPLTGTPAPSSAATAAFVKRRIASTNRTTIDITAPSSPTSTSVSSVKVNGVEMMSGGTTGTTTTSTLASLIAAKITLNGFTATSSGSTVTILAPDASYKDWIPVITQSGNLTLLPGVFPDTSTASQTNFANWYSYYRTRMLMMKTATGRAFKDITDNYRVGMMKISQSTPVINMGSFTDAAPSTQRTDWYNALYGMSVSGSTPLRTALSNAGRYFAHKLSGATDPMQYSCQQNFAILSTDGYWNSGDGYLMDGSTLMDNEDGTLGRPMYDGSQAVTTVTIQYTRNSYSSTSTGCSGSKKQLKTQPQVGTCNVTVTPPATVTGSESCTPATWTNSGSATLSGSCVSSVALPNPNPSTKVKVSATTTPGTVGGSSNSLSDVAMYYYQNDLRTSTLGNCTGAAGVDVCENNVFISSNDSNTQQHMTTFTLGLGASGWMNYSPSYLTDTTGNTTPPCDSAPDYVAVKLGCNAKSTVSPPVCPWQADGTVCNWPLPGMSGSDGLIANIDDLWHAAVDGHGAYFSATDPSSLSTGLANALSGIKARKGSSAAAATSTLNPVNGNNYAYVASYTTVSWKGNLEARGINIDTGVVNENATWCVENIVAGNCASPSYIAADSSGATTTYSCVTPNSVICNGGSLVGTDCYVPVATACTGTMNPLVGDLSDTRTIVTANSTSTGLVNFDATYAAAHPSYFDSTKQSLLSQWASLTTTQQANATATNLVNFLRGQHGYEVRTTNVTDNQIYRYREAVMGDALESQPAFISNPVFSYVYPGYSAYSAAQATRSGTVYIGANDGMMHAFNATTGTERWAYIPSVIVPNLWHLADAQYSTNHMNFVNGSPITSDICAANCTDAATAVWKTILVAGLNGGGRGYYALDITNPSSPALLWEFTTTAGQGSTKDDDLGYTYGPPVITRKVNGTWVVLVTSGYNNVSPGTGKGFLYVLNAATGAIISKISTGVGTTTTPSGLSKIAVWNSEPGGNLAGPVYGGDLLGNVWRFDIDNSASATIGSGAVMNFAQLFSDSAGTQPQPITTTPVLGDVGGKRMVFIGTGKYLESSDLSSTQVQSEYGIKDDNATATLINPRNTLVNQTLTAVSGTSTRTASNNTVNLSTGRGWYIDFPDKATTTLAAERENVDAKLVLGTLIIPTIVPSNTACSPGGYGWLNFVNYQTGGAVDNTGLASEKFDATIVGINVIYVGGQPKVLVVTSANPTPEQPNITPTFTGPPGGFVGTHTLWHELTQ